MQKNDISYYILNITQMEQRGKYKIKIIKLLGENTELNLHDFEFDKGFLMTTKTWTTKEIVDTFFHNKKHLCIKGHNQEIRKTHRMGKMF